MEPETEQDGKAGMAVKDDQSKDGADGLPENTTST
jgi:hypothetical protein